MRTTVPPWATRFRRSEIRRRRDVVAHETTSWRGVDRSSVGPIPCTSVVRTLLDLPAVVHPRRADQAMEDALRKGMCSVEQLADRWDALTQHPDQVIAQLREARKIQERTFVA